MTDWSEDSRDLVKVVLMKAGTADSRVSTSFGEVSSGHDWKTKWTFEGPMVSTVTRMQATIVAVICWGGWRGWDGMNNAR